MNKEEFLSGLRRKLSGLPQKDIEERIAFYSEMIDDRMEDGLSEEEAVAEIGTVDSIVEQIMSEIPLSKLVREKVKSKKSLKVWEIILLVLGSPVWLPILVSVLAIVLSLYVIIWAAAVCIYAACFSMAAGAVGGIAGLFISLFKGAPAVALFSLGAAAVCAGLAILLFYVSVWATKLILKMTKRIILGIKTSFVGMEE